MGQSDNGEHSGGRELLPAALLAPAGLTAPQTDEEARALLVRLGICPAQAPALVLEAFGGLRIRTGCGRLPLRAGTIGEALAVLLRVYPAAKRFLDSEDTASEHYRFSLNGHQVTRDLNTPLSEGDHLILFSASVGG